MLGIAVVSGKGGVGKTMVSVAIATELARQARTLLIDLDFFNRGLTGLFASLSARSHHTKVEPPQIFDDTLNKDRWDLIQIEPNLFTVGYGDIDKSSSSMIETADTLFLVMQLSNFVNRVASAVNCEVIILDCHGGPDNVSFAACLLSRHVVLVSEPDKITLYGTLNFIRQLKAVTDNRSKVDLHLVFNKVIPAFKSTFLFRFYNDNLRNDFGGNDLLAIYPLETHLTKAF